MEINAGLATKKDIKHIITIQKQNHQDSLTTEQKRDGYVTFVTTSQYLSDLLKSKHWETRVLVCKFKDELEAIPSSICGYLITVHEEDALKHPFLKKFVKKVKDGLRPYMITAQIAVYRGFKGGGIGGLLYECLFDNIDDRFEEFPIDRIVAEMPEENEVSFNFHKKHGFKIVKDYSDNKGRKFMIIEKTADTRIYISNSSAKTEN